MPHLATYPSDIPNAFALAPRGGPGIVAISSAGATLGDLKSAEILSTLKMGGGTEEDVESPKEEVAIDQEPEAAAEEPEAATEEPEAAADQEPEAAETEEPVGEEAETEEEK